MKYIYILIIIFFLGGCKSTPEYLNTEQLKKNYQTLGFGHFYVEKELRFFQKQLKNHYNTPIKVALEERGFKIVDASSVYDHYQELLQNSDNLYDPLTGQKNENMNNNLWKRALVKTKQELGIDAFVFSGVDTVRAHFTNSLLLGYVAKWFGQEESYLVGGAGGTDVLTSFFQNQKGYLPGSRVYIQVRDEKDKLLTMGSGGIELISQFNSDEEIVTKTPDKLFKDQSKLDGALKFAMETIDTWKAKK